MGRGAGFSSDRPRRPRGSAPLASFVFNNLFLNFLEKNALCQQMNLLYDTESSST